ncbi:MAG TPA: DUF1080 domain-containing protein [Puia sp.]|nr:DUF1080 domain-containing protein [Puia sp.]
MHIRVTTIALASLAILLFSFFMPVRHLHFQNGDNMLTDAEKKSGWVLLFDGKTTDKWRTYNNLPDDSWEIVDGQLHCKKDGVTHRADLVTKNQYASFDIQLDWKVDKSANSGLLYHVVEKDKKAPYETGPEYQLIDDLGYTEKLEDWQKSGADYAMHPPLKMASKPVGEYNHTELIVNGAHVQHWLNGVKVADFTAWTPEWEKLKSSGKWKDYPDYGNAKSGYIDLQDHGGGIWFKNIKIKKL